MRRSSWLFIPICFISFLVLTQTGGGAMAADVREACEGDFRRYCSSYDYTTPSGRACMRSMGRSHRLTRECIRALEEAGEVTAADRAAYRRRHQ